MPQDRVVYGDDVVPLMYWEHEPLRIYTTVTSPLACEESCHPGIPRHKRYGSHHDGSTSRIPDTLTHVR